MKISKDFWKGFGPGLLFAGSAVGVSHLVQSTRAGAIYGYGLVWAVILANLFKYPFFEFGSRYANATGETLIDGYRRLGKGYLWTFILLTLSTMWIVMAAVTLVTVAMLTQLMDTGSGLVEEAMVVLAVCAGILVWGHYKVLDRLMKAVITLLTLSTITAVVLALCGPTREPVVGFQTPAIWSLASLPFLVALMGWMPAPIDLSVWSSTWTLAKERQSKKHLSFSTTDLDFNIGYIATAVLAVCFLSLGALIMHGSGQRFANGGIGFAKQFIGMYVATLGPWTKPVILVAAFTTMFSTTLTATDAYSRVLSGIGSAVQSKEVTPRQGRLYYLLGMLVLVAGASIVLSVFQKRMLSLVDLATTISFVSNPLLGYINLKAVHLDNVPEDHRPPAWLRTLAYIGLTFLVAFAVTFLWVRFF